MKFFIFSALLLGTSFAQFGFVNDVVNSVKNAVQVSVSTV